MKRHLMIGVSILTGLAAFGIILKTINFQDVMEVFKTGTLLTISGYVLISIILIYSLGWRWKIVLKSQNIKVPFINIVVYRFIGYGVSYLTPFAKLGGEPVRAGLLTRHNVNFSKALSSVVIDKTIEISSAALFFFIGVMIVLFRFALPGQTEIMMLFFSIAFLALMFFVYQRMVSGKGFIKDACKLLRLDKIKKIKYSEKKIESFESRIIKFFHEDKKDFTYALLVSFLSWILMFFEYKMAGLVLGYNLSFIAIFLIVSFVGMAFLIPIPMAMGSLEASQIAVFTMLGIKSAAGVALALLVRARDLMWSLIGMIFLSYFGFKINQTLKKGYDK